MTILECGNEAEALRIWPVMRQLRNTIREERFLERFAAARAEGYRMFAAERDGAIAGAIGWRIVNDLAFGRSLYVDDLVVDEGRRGEGVGRELLDFAREAARRDGCEVMRLSSSFHRTGAHAFYEKAGMERAGYVFREPVRART